MEFVANSSSLSDRQCYKQSYDLNICSYFPDCSDVQVILTLAKSNTSDYVSVIEDRSALEMTVEVPERCSCSTKPPPSALSDAAIAAVVLAVLVALALFATVVLAAVFYCRERKKKM